ncbi:MAG: HD-GYP domain-containing protein [Anaerosomatales bacterium]|nr:HD-GYP domain-containing protein [Anaerosomatales bacterium]
MRRRLGIVGRYALESFILSTAMAVLLGVAVTWIVDDTIVNESSRSMSTMVNAVIVEQLHGADLSGPLDQVTSDHLDQEIAANLRVGGIDTIKLWNADGTLVYSSDGEGVGLTFDDHPAIVAALSGEVVSQIERRAEDESRSQFERLGTLMEIYAPLYRPGLDKPFGVFETYQSYAPVQTLILRANLVIWGIVIFGALLLYVTQLQIVRKAEHRLRHTEAEAALINERLERSLRDIEEHSVGTLQALVTAVDAKDSYTARHSLGVTEYALAIGRRMKLDANEMRQLEVGGLLHDIGKIGVSEAILLKPGRLDPDERHVIEEHSEMGARIIESIPFVRDLVPAVRHHHERWDGTGYPDGLLGERIPLLARVLAVADAFDAMMSDRPYRSGMRLSEARAELMRFRGIQFDPACVDALLASLDAGELWSVSHHQLSQDSATA